METIINPQKNKQKTRQKLMIEGALILGFGLILALIMPMVLEPFRLKLLGRFLALGITALGIDLIWGFTGLLSLGHGIFFALGGYALAMHMKLQIPDGQIPEFFTLYGVTDLPFFWKPFASFPFTFIAIFVIPAIVAAILGYLVFRNRIKGVYFSILTQAALLVFFNFFNGQQKLINGTNGLKTDTDTIFGIVAGSNQAQIIFYELTILGVIIVYLLCRWLTSGRFGRLLIAIRDDEMRLRFSGYDPTPFKVLVFGISGAIAGLAGSLYTVQSGLITPETMKVAFSIEMVIWVAVGGRSTLIGAIIGALLVNFGSSLLSEKFPAIWLFFQGALFLIVVTVLPDGIVGWVKNDGLNFLKFIFRVKPPVVAFPELVEDPEILQEKEELSNDK
jgi:urea transport system permease protein